MLNKYEARIQRRIGATKAGLIKNHQGETKVKARNGWNVTKRVIGKRTSTNSMNYGG